jgi:CRP-like cAMP-binding protein
MNGLTSKIVGREKGGNMSREIVLRDGLRDQDLVWLFRVGEEKNIESGATLIREGHRTDDLFVVVRGQFSVRKVEYETEHLATLGAGELIGEISFLEGSPASATIVAEQGSVVLAIDHQELKRRIIEDVAFAARLYRAFALVAERRLRTRVDNLVFLFEFGAGAYSHSAILETAHSI